MGKEVLFLQKDVFKLMFLVTTSVSVSSEAFGWLWLFFFLLKSVYLFYLTDSPYLLLCVADSLHSHDRWPIAYH